MKINIKFKVKRINIRVEKANLFGLMFKPQKTENLLFDFDRDVTNSITSLFVFFPFLAIWLDKNNKVLESRVITPLTLTIRPKNKFRKLIEIPFNKGNEEIINFFVGKGRKI